MESSKKLKMTDDEVILSREESEKRKKGLYVKGEKLIDCPICRQRICSITVIDDRPIETTHTIVCPDCKEDSFIIKSSGSYIYDYPYGIEPVDIEYEYNKEKNTHKSRLILERKK